MRQAGDSRPLRSPEKLEGAEETRPGSSGCAGVIMVTKEILRELFLYDRVAGCLKWISPYSNRVKVGDIACCIHKSSGYAYTKVYGRQYKTHRLIWMYFYGEFPSSDIDHINGCRSDNRIENLRSIDHAVNMQNQRSPSKNNKTGFLGVHLEVRSNKYKASICNKRKVITIGYFDRAEDAHAAYLNKKRALHAGCTI